MDAKESKDVESSVSKPVTAAHDAQFVLIPQPSTHPRDPLVCHDYLPIRAPDMLFEYRAIDLEIAGDVLIQTPPELVN